VPTSATRGKDDDVEGRQEGGNALLRQRTVYGPIAQPGGGKGIADTGKLDGYPAEGGLLGAR